MEGITSSLPSFGAISFTKKKRRNNGPGNSREQHTARSEERKWQQLFDDPAKWSDNRSSKKSPKDPDFVHVFTWEGLWIDSCGCPSWVPIKLESLGTKDRSNVLPSDQETLKLYSRMREQGSAPGISLILAALKACSNLKQLEIGMEIHSRLDSDEASNDFVASALVHMYSACGSLQSARSVFEKMVAPDLVAWNAMIRSYVQGGDGDRALGLFSRMETTGIEPDGRTFVAALNACASGAEKAGIVGSREEFLEIGKRIHARAAKKRLDLEDMFLASSLVDMYAKCGSMEEARRVFQRVGAQKADVALWTAMIFGYSRAGDAKLALEFFCRMKSEGGIRPNARTFVAAIAACTSLATRRSIRPEVDDDDHRELLEKGRLIHSQIVELGLELDRYVSSSLVDFYSKCGSMIEARRVFDRIPLAKRDVVLWTSLVLGYAQGGEGEIALELFSRMQCAGLRPNARAFVAALAACSSLAAERQESSGKVSKLSWLLGRTMELHAQAARTNDLEDVFVTSSLLDLYSKCGGSNLERTNRVFDQMASHDVVSFTAVISGYAQSQAPDMALAFLSSMKREGHSPNASTYAAAIKACAKMAAVDAGRKLYLQACKAELGEDSAVACAAIDFYGKCGSMVAAKQVFDCVTKIPSNKSDPVIWSSLISGYSHNGDAPRVFDLFETMRKERVKPDSITFLSVLAACSHAGIVDRGKELFFSMSSPEYGLKPAMEHYNCVIDMLGRANRLDDAFLLAKTMPWKPSVEIWTTLLDASRKWGNLRVGRAAFQAIKGMDERNSASYVLMAETLISC
ncbi:pentatricopeptide repeat-containing protein At4g18520, chloroplastic-like [Selaginella moellendorffii]|uniref:pentatricopeptide repeat-containing protein At4g18520, chloroplastic-like n=1 Tax=Selaginella moellendorffii TaxID=88036 RepID=UPI000D1C7DE7|nr:pentatricopeptide repeat-containing protein At4g18520, chloroplastic-like [Selaginella moellendorffii]|eukprot:XP_024545216.1 pentatricopeptide repeat-containing protein At4g18520, chloroplastic-like [Selaginella moellendorffii]